MQFPAPLIKATLIKRYKRFLADCTLEDGTLITAHTANPGAMLGLKDEGLTVYLSKSENPKRKLPYSWELVELTDNNKPHLVGINTALPNKLVEEALINKKIAPLKAYDTIKREVKYGQNSRIDFLLTQAGLPDCYLEIKNVHLKRSDNLAEFPDSVTKRGVKHLNELIAVKKAGAKAVNLYLIQRTDCDQFTIANDIDKAYGAAFLKAKAEGVEMLAYDCTINRHEIALNTPVMIKDPAN